MSGGRGGSGNCVFQDRFFNRRFDCVGGCLQYCLDYAAAVVGFLRVLKMFPDLADVLKAVLGLKRPRLLIAVKQ